MKKLSQLWIRLLMLALCQTQASAQVMPRLEVMYSGWKQEPFQPDLHNDIVRHPEDGALYGTSKKGGALGYGMIFRLTDDGEMQALVQFTGAVGPFKGAEPSGALVVGADGGFYGMTTKGGRSDSGTLFKVTRQGEFTTLIDLGESTLEVRGSNPSGGLILAPDGNFYGTTSRDGHGSAGTFFRLTPGGVFTTLRDFHAERSILGRLVVGPDGHFYGMARDGGLGVGSIFRVTTAGVMTSLVEFTGSDGTFPTGGLTVGGDGLLYGMTPEGGDSRGGTLFSLTTDGVLSKLIHFAQEQPLGNLTLGTDGLLYGMTQFGGTSGAGKVFRLSAEGVLTTLVNFSDTGSSNKGALPMGSLTLAADGHFYGMTSAGGAFGHGTVFRLTMAGDLTTLYEMRRDGAGDTGGMPLSGLVRASDGNFYGMTRRGGTAGHGTLFQMSTTGVRTTLVDFPRLGDVSVGPQPQGRLIQGSDGDLYGMTRAGGSYGYGSVFRVTTGGVMTTLTSFRGQYPWFVEPESPFGGLVEGAAGHFYGATNYGGMSDLGALFKITSSGSYTHLLDFTGMEPQTKGLE